MKMRNVETVAHTTFSLKPFFLYIITKSVRFYNYIQYVLAGKYNEKYNPSKDSLV